MKIAFFEIQDWEKQLIEKSFKGNKLYFSSLPIDESNLKDIMDFDIISPFIYSNITKRVLSFLPNLKFISTRSTGFDHIDLNSVSRKRIILSNVPSYGENTVAEHTFALILSISRNIHKSYLRTMANDFSIDGLKGFDLQGKTLGVIGTGHIGQHVIRIAGGFGMNVIAYDLFPNKEIQKNLKFSYSSFDFLLRNSDIITLHLPYTKKNLHLIGKNSIDKMKNNAILINTSRGELVDTKELLNALNENRIAGAGLDVIEGESLIKEEKQLLHSLNSRAIEEKIKDLKLIRNEKVVFTPHIAFYSNEALLRIIQTTISNINSFINNKPQNIIRGNL